MQVQQHTMFKLCAVFSAIVNYLPTYCIISKLPLEGCLPHLGATWLDGLGFFSMGQITVLYVLVAFCFSKLYAFQAQPKDGIPGRVVHLLPLNVGVCLKHRAHHARNLKHSGHSASTATSDRGDSWCGWGGCLANFRCLFMPEHS